MLTSLAIGPVWAIAALSPALGLGEMQKSARTKVTVFEPTNTSVGGLVHSPKTSCKRGRTVKLERDVGSGSEIEGSAKSDDTGSFLIDGAFVPSNKYFLAAPARHGCKGGRSDRFAIQ